MSHSTEIMPSLHDFEKMHDFIAGRAISAAVYVAAKLGIADKLKEGPQNYQHLANSLCVDSAALYRLLRALAGEKIFLENEDGEFELTRLGSTLCTGNTSLRDLTIMCGDPWHWEMWGGLLQTIQTGIPYFESYFGKPFFSYIKENPEVADGFNAAMSSLSSLSNYVISETVNFDAAQQVVDVGGGQGGLLISILKKYPHLSGILYDLPKTIESTRFLFQQEGLSDRCALVSGDFFVSVPAGADIYIVKHVLHGLSDDQSTTLLKHIRSAAKDPFRLFIVEMMIPAANLTSYSKFNDLGMMMLSKTGMERTEDQFKNLLETAGMEIVSINSLCMGLAIIEARNSKIILN